MADKTSSYETKDKLDPYKELQQQFSAAVIAALGANETSIAERNAAIAERDEYTYGDALEKYLDIPVGHDFTPVNWLRRTIEIHKNQFMGRGFTTVSTYELDDIDNVDPEDQGRIQVENDRRKAFAEQRKSLVESVIRDNGGNALFSMLAESSGLAGDAAVKCWFDKDADKYVISPIESIENLHVIWARDDFRSRQAVAYVYQMPKSEAIRDYGVPEDVPTSPLGQPLVLESNRPVANNFSTQKMVTVLEITGLIEGWGTENGKIKQVSPGKENEFNAVIVSNCVYSVIDDKLKMPKYYILPNKRQRRRPWGVSDISDAAININVTYVETLSDWRTVAAKVNFPKYKGFGFGKDTQMPKTENRKVQILPLADGQDIVPLNQEDANQIDFRAQMDELKEQFVRETGISRVLFDDPSVTFNSNQALLTSMKPTSDIAEAKKQLWTPILVEMFTDALEVIAANKPELKDLVDTDDNWGLRIIWPSVLQKEDPIYQSNLLNRFNAGLLSVQSYMEAQGDSNEEIDRLKDEATDPVTAAILGKAWPQLAQIILNAATAELQAWYQASLPQEVPSGGAPNSTGVNSNGGAAMVAPEGTQVDTGMAPVSQPGTGATAASAGGAVAQVAQNGGA